VTHLSGRQPQLRIESLLGMVDSRTRLADEAPRRPGRRRTAGEAGAREEDGETTWSGMARCPRAAGRTISGAASPQLVSVCGRARARGVADDATPDYVHPREKSNSPVERAARAASRGQPRASLLSTRRARGRCRICSDVSSRQMMAALALLKQVDGGATVPRLPTLSESSTRHANVKGPAMKSSAPVRRSRCASS